MPPRAVVVGPAGAGKTTVGQLLAAHLNVSFRDTDLDVEHRAGRGISEIFATDGEQTFRAFEEEAVTAALAEHDGVVAVGGGAVLSERTRCRLSGHAVVFLSVGVTEGARRTGLSTARPLLTGLNPRATFKAQLEARLPLYREVAVVEVDTDGVEPAEVARRIAAELKPTPSDPASVDRE